MVITRSAKNNMDTFTQKLDETLETKLAELKDSILQEYKAAIDQYFEQKKKDFLQFVNENELSRSIAVIQNHVRELKEENTILRTELEDVQQYTRRPNLRLYGIPVEPNESSQTVLNKVKNIITENGLEIPMESLDRGHRIGKKDVKDGVSRQAVIVRFTSFRDRTVMYRARKQIKEKSKIGVSLDLTKYRLGLLKQARGRVEGVEGIQFVYSDVNCGLRVFTSDKRHLLFGSMSELNEIIDHL